MTNVGFFEMASRKYQNENSKSSGECQDKVKKAVGVGSKPASQPSLGSGSFSGAVTPVPTFLVGSPPLKRIAGQAYRTATKRIGHGMVSRFCGTGVTSQLFSRSTTTHPWVVS
jgi:hypothetical protein